MGQNFNTVKNQFNNAVSSDLQKNSGISKAYSWPVIIALLIFFFPVGFYLLYKRFTVDKTATGKNVKGLRNTGLILIGIGLFYTIMGIAGELDTSDGSSVVAGDIILLAIFGGTGLVFLLTSIKMKKYGEKYKKYISIIVNQKQHILDNIASSVGVTYETSLVDLQKMLEFGYFPGAYINESNREFVLPEKQQIQTNIPKTSQTKVVTCKSCGANNTVTIGRANECEYCGSPIESYI